MDTSIKPSDTVDPSYFVDEQPEWKQDFPTFHGKLKFDREDKYHIFKAFHGRDDAKSNEHQFSSNDFEFDAFFNEQTENATLFMVKSILAETGIDLSIETIKRSSKLFLNHLKKFQKQYVQKGTKLASSLIKHISKDNLQLALCSIILRDTLTGLSIFGRFFLKGIIKITSVSFTLLNVFSVVDVLVALYNPYNIEYAWKSLDHINSLFDEAFISRLTLHRDLSNGEYKKLTQVNPSTVLDILRDNIFELEDDFANERICQFQIYMLSTANDYVTEYIENVERQSPSLTRKHSFNIEPVRETISYEGLTLLNRKDKLLVSLSIVCFAILLIWFLMLILLNSNHE